MRLHDRVNCPILLLFADSSPHAPLPHRQPGHNRNIELAARTMAAQRRPTGFDQATRLVSPSASASSTRRAGRGDRGQVFGFCQESARGHRFRSRHRSVLQFVVSGFAIGAVCRLIGMALAITFYVTRIINFAQGQMMMATVLIAAEVRAAGYPTWPAALLGLGCARALGVFPISSPFAPSWRSTASVLAGSSACWVLP